MKARIPKTIRNTVISIFILVIIFVVAGVVYVLVTDGSTPKEAATAPAAKTETEPALKPTPPAPNASEGVSVEAVTSPVVAGSNSSITVRTNAGSACKITVSYNNVQSTDSGLTTKTADPYGNATWTWTVGNVVPAGTWPISVTCAYHGRTGMVQSSYQVTKQ